MWSKLENSTDLVLIIQFSKFEVFLFEINSKFYNYTALYYKMGLKSLDVEGLGFKEC